LTEYKRLICDCIADRHVHPDYSFDAEGSLDDYCQMAMNIGLLEICFTTHYDADPARLDHEGYMVISGNREKLSGESVKHYLNEIRRAHEQYGPLGVMVRGGFEFGYFDGCEKIIAPLKEKFDFDLSLGAVHGFDDKCILLPDEARRAFAKYSLEAMANRYFEELDKCAATGLFDVLAHIDIYRRYGLEYYGDEIMTVHRGRIEKVFETMARKGVGFEVNTSAIRHGHHEYYPNMDIVNMAREAGVQLVSLGSDAHCPKDLALDFDAASAVAYELIPYVDE